ncbi:GntR family transcriptional regulator [Pseudoclavibacter sp. RFBJ3]|uniref:GntR family transcriptional regulator n=1 Tax=unclassified Pseudoclavibacter TaxID=2615177 RepID=UPI000CE8C5D2|nr:MULTISPECIES: GntR family transcriptional regulator [unclassified Pseudoclavibacter]PPF86517.1 GntR family transcriptional regulator [Pseudoclavibacter sp. RFBJ5]PPF95250.1 GntR family transcriptional regulator [Pseudoclavibacter sp. RFBJ3]PPF97684.1 GntR family transcriptional regulator [Pseudoclavibacter sp. RFBH5]PPG22663.1 GntR family transcriptional regulator [Pseudoclavibacter sp. RFBI4]
MSAAATLGLQSQQTSAIIADHLREQVIDGSFAPGAQLNEARIAADYEVSRGPVREALQRLVQEGLLESRRNRGVFVRELTDEDAAEIFAAREVLECAAAAVIAAKPPAERASIASALSAVVAELHEAAHAGDEIRALRLDHAFHRRFVESAGNSRLSRAYSTIATESLICTSHAIGAHPALGDFSTHHEELVRLTEQGDIEGIHEAVHRHLTPRTA